MLNAIEETIGASAILKFRSGPPPATCADADAGTVVSTMNLPSDYMAAASGGAKAKSGTWEDSAADNSGRISHYRFYASDGTTCHEQGLCVGPWTPSTAYAVGDYVTNDTGKVYVCDQAGTSNSSGGPTGTGSNIADSGARWDYVQAAAEMTINTSYVTAGMPVEVTSYGHTAGNA